MTTLSTEINTIRILRHLLGLVDSIVRLVVIRLAVHSNNYNYKFILWTSRK